METKAGNELKNIIEALLFVNEKPLMVEQIKNLFQGVDSGSVRDCFLGLKDEYENNKRGIRIAEIAGGFQLVSASCYGEIIKNFYKKRKVDRLSKAGLEALAIVAYRQPVTRVDIELIRGVSSGGVLDNLIDRGLVRVVGRKKTVGRPFVYGSTRQFLEYFGLRSLGDLPKIEEFAKLAGESTQSDKKNGKELQGSLVKSEAITEEDNANQKDSQ